MSGRKNWNADVLRYGRCVAYAAWWEQDATHRQQFEQRAARFDRARWRELRQETTLAHHEQLTRFRFRHKRPASLHSLEERWAAASPAHSFRLACVVLLANRLFISLGKNGLIGTSGIAEYIIQVKLRDIQGYRMPC